MDNETKPMSHRNDERVIYLGILVFIIIGSIAFEYIYATPFLIVAYNGFAAWGMGTFGGKLIFG